MNEKKIFLILLLLVFANSYAAKAQSLPIGHTTVSYTDPARNNRPVPAEIYYPAVVAGNNTALAPGLFPVISLGHGFQMAYDSYAWFKNAMVPEGYILVFTKTESGLSPDHAAFGADLAFLVMKLQAEGTDPASAFFQHVDATSAIMGHSMGGGASFLACENNPVPTAMVTWAAAETSPSAINAAQNIITPSLVFAADQDCVTPPDQHQVPMYEALGSDCKVYINIKGGGHCYFGDANFLCSLGEIGCQQNFTITREQQHAATLDFTKPFLDHYLKNDSSAWALFNDSLATSPRITFQKSCTVTSTETEPEACPFMIFPNPAGNIATFEGPSTEGKSILVRITDSTGRILSTFGLESRDGRCSRQLDTTGWPAGLLTVEITTAHKRFVIRFVKK